MATFISVVLYLLGFHMQWQMFDNETDERSIVIKAIGSTVWPFASAYYACKKAWPYIEARGKELIEKIG